MSRSYHQLAAVLAAAMGFSAAFVLTTVQMDQVPDSVLVGVPLLIAAAIALATTWRELPALRSPEIRRSVLLVSAGGVACFWAAPLLALSQRASDAPAGSVTLFLTSSCWALACVALAVATRSESLSATALAGAVASVVGAMGVLANWERPSSFSPFAKFPQQEALLLVAGLLFAAGALAMARGSQSVPTRLRGVLALGAAAVPGAFLGAVQYAGSSAALERGSTEFVLLGVSVFAFAWGWTSLVAKRGVGSSAAALLVAPALLTLLSVVERATGVYGPNPILWRAALPSIAVVVGGAAIVWLSPRRLTSSSAARAGGVMRALTIASAVSLVVAAGSLWLPAMNAQSQGVLGEPFSAEWVVLGLASAAGWMALAAAGLALAAAYAAGHGASRVFVVACCLTAFAACAAYPLLLDTTLRTWNSFVPADVQQAYGTEYARFGVSGIAHPVRSASVVLSGALALAVAVLSMRPSPEQNPPSSEAR